MREMNFSYEPQPILTINNQVKKSLIDLNPNFQRGYIWKREFKDELIVSILSGYPIGNIIIYKTNGKMEVVDGQQRLVTITNFIGDKESFYEVKTKKSVANIKNIVQQYYDKYESILDVKDIKDFNELLKKKHITFKDFPELIKDDFMSYNLNVTYLTSIDNKYIAEYFKYVQNQETLKAGEIINSMYIYNNALNDLTSKIDDKSNLVSSLGINSKRYEFDKHFINFIGVLSKKIPLNSTQSAIIDYAKDFDSRDINDNVIMLINNLNLLSSYCLEQDITFSLNTRMLKVLLSYLSFFDLESNMILPLASSLKSIDSSHKKGDISTIEEITFIERSTKTFDDIKKSAGNLHLRLSAHA